MWTLKRKHRLLGVEEETRKAADEEQSQRIEAIKKERRRRRNRPRRSHAERRVLAQIRAYFHGREDGRREAYASVEADEPAPIGPALREIERLKNEITEIQYVCSERERALADAREDAALLRQIIDALPIGVTAVDASGQFLVFSRAVEAMAGLGAIGGGPRAWTDQYGVFMSDGVTPYPAEELPITCALRGEIVDGAEAVLRAHGASEGTRILTDARPLVDARGGVRGAVAVTRDVSARRHVELGADLDLMEEPPATSRHLRAFATSVHEELPRSRPPGLSRGGPEIEARLLREVDAQLTLAAQYCLETQDERGAWEVHPDARMFDTGLVAYALSTVPGPDTEQAVRAARRWLEGSTPQAHEALARVLDESPRMILARRGPIDLRAPAFYSDLFRRKALLLYALGLHAGLDVLAPLTLDAVRAKIRAMYERRLTVPMKQWGRVDLVSIYVLFEHLAKAPGAEVSGASDAVQFLESSQAADGSFCHNPVSTAVAFLALSAASPGSRAWERCLRHLLDAQQADGTWRFCTSDIWDTSLTVRAFRDHPLFRSEAFAPAVRFLVGSQNEDGGWGFRTDVESDNDTSSCALLALRGMLDERPEVAERAVRYLCAQQREDGLWNTWQSAEDQPVEDCVAHVVGALAPYEQERGLKLNAARHWLAHRYLESGYWNAGWYRNLPYSILEVGRGLGRRAPVVRAAAASLVPHQNKDGGFPAEPDGESRASSTGLALATLMDHFALSEPFILRGLRYLLETQRRDGTWPGHPELCGPRPLLYHLQTNTHAFAAYGLLAARRKARS